MDTTWSNLDVEKDNTYLLNDAINEHFNRILGVLADTSVFGRPDSPSVFIVYAHDNDDVGSATAWYVKCLIKWLLAIRCSLLSDKSPLRCKREGGIAAARNILSNQLCLLPRSGGASLPGNEVTGVEKVVLCGSKVLQQYYGHGLTAKYLDEIITFYEVNAKSRDANHIQDGIRDIVERNYDRDEFHHVMTELAFLDLRRRYRRAEDDGIVPFTLDGSGMKYLPFLEGCDLYLSLQSEALDHQHKLFFKLLRQLYASPQAHSVIDNFQECYENACLSFTKEHTITREIFSSTSYREINKAQVAVLRSLGAEIRDEDWRKEWQSKTSSEFSRRDKILHWLPNYHHILDIHKHNLQQREDHTGAWMLKDERYVKWKDSKPVGSTGVIQPARLWCYGKPGAGKTIMSSIIIEDLESSVVNPEIGLAYAFCKYGEGQTASELILNLVAQLAFPCRGLSKTLVTISEEHNKRNSLMTPSLAECIQMLVEQVDQHRKVFLVIDALDEILDENHAYYLLFGLLKTKANILITSRDIEIIGKEFAGADVMEIAAQPEDVKVYLDSRLQQSQAHRLRRVLTGDPTLQSKIIESLVSKTDGMFLRPRMHMDLLIDAVKEYPTKRTIEKAVKELPLKVDEMYNEYMRRIIESPSAQHAKDVLAWIIFAKEPVPMKVIQEAISILHSGDLGDLVESKTLLEYCIGLVMEESSLEKTVAFAHPDMGRYFRNLSDEKREEWFPDGTKRITAACLHCLDLESIAESPLWSYATMYWGYHVQDSYEYFSTLVTRYLKSGKVSLALRYSMLRPRLVPIETNDGVPTRYVGRYFINITKHVVPSQIYGCHAAAFFGLGQYFETDGAGEIENRDSNGWTPIWWAVLGRQDGMVESLLEKGADINIKSILNLPLGIWMLGTFEGPFNKWCVGDFTMTGDDRIFVGGPNYLAGELTYSQVLQDFSYSTIHFASLKSIQEVIKRLPDEALDIRAESGETMLMIAAGLWRYDVVRQLIARGVDKSLRRIDGQTAFAIALRDHQRHYTIKNVCLSGSAKFEVGYSIIISPGTVLNPWSFEEWKSTIGEMIVQLVPDDLDVHTEEGRQALRLATINRCSQLVETLLVRGADPNTIYEDGSTPLGLACMPPVVTTYDLYGIFMNDDSGVNVIRNVSIQKSVNSPGEWPASTPNSRTYEKFTLSPFDEIVRLLLSHGAEIDLKSSGKAPLALAAENMYITIFRTLLEEGANITEVDGSDINEIRNLLQPEVKGFKIDWKDHPSLFWDFNLHDYCLLLIDFAIPRTFSITVRHEGGAVVPVKALQPDKYPFGLVGDSIEDVSFGGDTRDYRWKANAGDLGTKRVGDFAPREERKVGPNGVPKNYRLTEEMTQLSEIILSAFKKAGLKSLTLRDEFWAFGNRRSKVTLPSQTQYPMEPWSWKPQWWKSLVCHALMGIVSNQFPMLMSLALNVRWSMPRQRYRNNIHSVGLRQRTDFWMRVGTCIEIPEKYHYWVLEYILVRGSRRYLKKLDDDFRTGPDSKVFKLRPQKVVCEETPP
ncbi:ankyrin [Corynespora cassiicola Philippines]|uniref:Ankyrin n=1 Tax=Corynespora cassiicola Philippines TaxID=1448308 RepID=A0A2T2NFF4_CORCC|nr:ankyrin [Corynespora cassiicola Philippines]